jgi:putative Holliday junction resolvase
VSRAAGPILAIDLGSVRIGLALSDPAGRYALPLGALERDRVRRDLSGLERLVHEHGVTRAVVGLPLLLSGAEGESAARARRFAGRLRAAIAGLEVELWDERLTTVEAERMMAEAQVKRGRRKRAVDSLAAMLILQSYLEAHAIRDAPPR